MPSKVCQSFSRSSWGDIGPKLEPKIRLGQSSLGEWNQVKNNISFDQVVLSSLPSIGYFSEMLSLGYTRNPEPRAIPFIHLEHLHEELVELKGALEGCE